MVHPERILFSMILFFYLQVKLSNLDIVVIFGVAEIVRNFYDMTLDIMFTRGVCPYLAQFGEKSTVTRRIQFNFDSFVLAFLQA